MNFTVTGISVETEGMTAEQLEQAKIFSGKNAGICYMKDSYFNSAVTDPDKALTRFSSTCKNAHHSIADHVQIEVLLEGVSKMLAIVLNSLQDYSTSEKSGRYTEMTGNSDKEVELYNKWKDIFRLRLLEINPSMDDIMLMKLMAKAGHDDVIVTNGKLDNNSMADYDDEHKRVLTECKKNISLPSVKLAQENARYILSVFTRNTTMGYSTSLRQWNYIYDWCQKYINQYMPRYDDEYVKSMASNGKEGKITIVYKGTDTEVTFFERELYFDFLKLSNFIFDTMYIPELRDTKDRHFSFLVGLSGQKDDEMIGYDLSCFEPNGYTGEYEYNETTHSSDDSLGMSYNVAYTASFVHIAQAERHRTLKYFMYFNPRHNNSEYFIPPMLRGTHYEDEWLKDLKSIEDIVPQATKVCIVETGFIGDFLLKCEERLCSRAQYEVMNQTKLTAMRFVDAINNKEITNNVCINFVKKFADIEKGQLYTKCKITGQCNEACKRVNEALSRLY